MEDGGERWMDTEEEREGGDKGEEGDKREEGKKGRERVDSDGGEREWSLCSVSRKYSQDRIKRNFLSSSLKYLNSSSMSPSMSLS